MADAILKRTRPEDIILFVVVLLLLISGSVLTTRAQSRELSLADVLIALRSKKADAAEKNKLLSDAVKQRGITFSLTPEIEKELGSTGADGQLIAAIKLKALPLVASTAQPETKPEVKPVEDFAFFRTRATARMSANDLPAALADLDKALAMQPNDAGVQHDRAMILASTGKTADAIAAYSKAIELAPQDARNYAGRAAAFEKLDKAVDALGDYQKILSIVPADQSAAGSVIRITAALTRAATEAASKQSAAVAEKKVEPPPVSTAPAKTDAPIKIDAPVSQPASTANSDSVGPVDAGNLAPYCSDLVKPVVPASAAVFKASGEVTVNITLDEQGKVVEAKAASGASLLKSAAEVAAKRSKFKPIVRNGKPVKATGVMVYKFVL